jgi:hypothetical protein
MSRLRPFKVRRRFRSLTEVLDTTTAQGRLVFHMLWRAGRIRAQPDPGAHPSGPGRRAARWSHGRPTAETHRRRYRGRQGDARQSRHRRDANRARPRRVAGDALPIHSRRANREYPRRLITAALSQRPDAPGGSHPVRLAAALPDSGRSRSHSRTVEFDPELNFLTGPGKWSDAGKRIFTPRSR